MCPFLGFVRLRVSGKRTVSKQLFGFYDASNAPYSVGFKLLVHDINLLNLFFGWTQPLL